jgi:transposase
VRLAAAGECVVDVPPKLSARVRVLSSFAGNARNNDGLDALATALAASRNERLAAVDPQAASEVLRLLSERREDLVAERTRALNRLHALLRDLLPGGVAGKLSADRAVCRAGCAAYGPRVPRPASDVGWPRRYCA